MSFELKGKIHKKFETIQVSQTFQKRELVIEVDGAYPQLVSFQLVQDRCGILDDYAEGESVTVYFDIRGREWKSPKGEMKYFNSLNVWKMDKVTESTADNSAPETSDSFPSMEDAPLPSENGTDDLPF